jgi:hypothetical protein
VADGRKTSVLMARMAMGWAPQLRYWRLMVSLGYDWARPAMEQAERYHREAVAEVGRMVVEHPDWFSDEA